MKTMDHTPDCYGIIPARYQSSRFPGKPLAEILGQPMFRHVYQRATASGVFRKVVLATDDDRILAAAHAAGVEAIMTAADHSCGTERVLEAAERLGIDDGAVVVNIQGDEPALVPGMLAQLVRPFSSAAVVATTLARRITAKEAASPDTVKVVFAPDNHALYFSRAQVPFCRDLASHPCLYGHIGLYGYRFATLKKFVTLPPSPLEQVEKLEQLRLLEHNIPIHVVTTDHACHGVDRPEDIAVVEAMLRCR